MLLSFLLLVFSDRGFVESTVDEDIYLQKSIDHGTFQKLMMID
jgi:hypothetical protein